MSKEQKRNKNDRHLMAANRQLRASEQQLRAANQQLKASEMGNKQASLYARSLLEASLDPLVTISKQGKISDVNEATIKATGVPRKKLIGTDFSHYFTEPQKAREGYQLVFKKGFVADYPLTLKHKSGRLINVLYNATVYQDTKGNVLGVFAAARDITVLNANEQQLRAANQQLRASELQLKAANQQLKAVEMATRQAALYARSLIEASLDPLVTISKDGKITDVNEATIIATGIFKEKLIGTDFSNYFTEPENARRGYQEAFKKGFVSDYPLTLKHKNGKTMDVLYNARVYRDMAGNVIGVFAAARDITELKANEQQLRAANQQLTASEQQLKAANIELKASELSTKQAAQYARSLLEASFDPLVTISKDGIVTDVNEATIKATGMPRGKLIGTDFSNYFTEPEKARQGYQEVFKKGFVADYPLTLKHKSGKTMDVLYNATVYRDIKGNIIGVFAAARDITIRKQAETKAQEERKRLFNVLETLPVMVCLLTPDHQVAFANKAFQDKFGEPRGRRCYDFCFGNKAPCDFCESYKVLETGKPHHWEVNAPNGSVIDAYDFPFTDADGSPLILEMDLDITEQRKTQRALLESRTEMERGKRLSDIGTLAATVAHELRNPLAAISMAAHNIKRKRVNPDLDRHLVTINTKVTESDQIIDNLLFYSRLRSPHYEKVNVHTIIDECTNEFGKATKKDSKIIKNIDAIREAVIEADALQMKEVINNILNNAHDAVPAEKGVIDISAENEKEFIKVNIKDNGSGIGKDIIGKIFDPFFTTKAKGTGLGLSVCKQIVTMHEGEIGITSEPGKGTSIVLRLPKKRAVTPLPANPSKKVHDLC
ncbi:MAG: PAS domain S-box protein [Candidatus Omnitrophica bacterium]|nr:PAS domain S-box protein [Candidatus Omnitrophota bacterium]